ncbi:PHP family Zn ribbon phosphoesterase [Variovorax boronicumulans]|uniref:hypothetical protein n=1 Tax=Variovorax boronicumulans TaxID=436515 RepID=UPI00277DEBEB|nr:hypothetical protein [Variovorax boronicumulans]MDQ0036831.1 PHP family Zn ribbon phosphoesterase [Variovorax boronicumulans]
MKLLGLDHVNLQCCDLVLYCDTQQLISRCPWNANTVRERVRQRLLELTAPLNTHPYSRQLVGKRKPRMSLILWRSASTKAVMRAGR